jgi:D-serine dehydratase
MSGLPYGGLALSGLEEQMLLPGVKGLALQEALHQGALGVQGWNVLHGDTGFPVAVLKTSALRHNLGWMRAFCERHGVLLAPHGKTTMSPQLFGAQLAAGAWGITLATASQVQVAYRFGARRVLLANQLVARADLRAVLRLLRDDPDFGCFVLADSLAGVATLAEEAAALGLARPLTVLVELGLAGKRAGCRTPEQALTVARAIAGAPGLALAGFEGYEGVLVSTPTCRRWTRFWRNSDPSCAKRTTKACSARRRSWCRPAAPRISTSSRAHCPAWAACRGRCVPCCAAAAT